jgi:hypothetical protein
MMATARSISALGEVGIFCDARSANLVSSPKKRCERGDSMLASGAR